MSSRNRLQNKRKRRQAKTEGAKRETRRFFWPSLLALPAILAIGGILYFKAPSIPKIEKHNADTEEIVQRKPKKQHFGREWILGRLADVSKEISKTIIRAKKAGYPDIASQLTVLRENAIKIDKTTVSEEGLAEINYSYSRSLFELGKREIKKIKRKKQDGLVFDPENEFMFFSIKSRAQGEADLYSLADKEDNEEQYMFLRLKNRDSNEESTLWYEIGEEVIQGKDFTGTIVNIDKTILPLLFEHHDKYDILEISLYHYHPASWGNAGSPISYEDIRTAGEIGSRIRSLVPELNSASLDHIVINYDGAYSTENVTVEHVQRMREIYGRLPETVKMAKFRGQQFSNILRKLVIDASFRKRVK